MNLRSVFLNFYLICYCDGKVGMKNKHLKALSPAVQAGLNMQKFLHNALLGRCF